MTGVISWFLITPRLRCNINILSKRFGIFWDFSGNYRDFSTFFRDFSEISKTIAWTLTVVWIVGCVEGFRFELRRRFELVGNDRITWLIARRTVGGWAPRWRRARRRSLVLTAGQIFATGFGSGYRNVAAVVVAATDRGWAGSFFVVCCCCTTAGAASEVWTSWKKNESLLIDAILWIFLG